MKTISRETPLAEITLRRYEKPDKLGDRELVRKVCLSLGLLQAGDSRDVIVEVLRVMLLRKPISSDEVEEQVVALRKKEKLPLSGVAGSNIRRQLLRLRDAMLVEKIANKYRINEDASLSELFSEKIERYVLPSITSRVKEYLMEADKRFC